MQRSSRRIRSAGCGQFPASAAAAAAAVVVSPNGYRLSAVCCLRLYSIEWVAHIFMEFAIGICLGRLSSHSNNIRRRARELRVQQLVTRVRPEAQRKTAGVERENVSYFLSLLYICVCVRTYYNV